MSSIVEWNELNRCCFLLQIYLLFKKNESALLKCQTARHTSGIDSTAPFYFDDISLTLCTRYATRFPAPQCSVNFAFNLGMFALYRLFFSTAHRPRWSRMYYQCYFQRRVRLPVKREKKKNWLCIRSFLHRQSRAALVHSCNVINFTESFVTLGMRAETCQSHCSSWERSSNVNRISSASVSNNYDGN